MTVEVLTPDVVANLPALVRQQCHARAKSHDGQCRNMAIPGGTVCRIHGGAAPQVLRKAAENMAHIQEAAQELLLMQMGEHGTNMDTHALIKAIEVSTKWREMLEGRATSRSEAHELQHRTELTVELRGQLAQLAKGIDNMEARGAEGAEGAK